MQEHQRLGRYETLFRLAAGGMAEVHVARMVGEGGFEKLVAIKRMLPALAADERFVGMFLDEGRVAANISSPNVVATLDLGRADRIPVAMTHFNPTSVFGWNVILYPGFFAIVGIYLWTLMDRKMNPYYKPAGLAAFIWRLLLTTGTGSIFGFLVARQAYQSAMIAPMWREASGAADLTSTGLRTLFPIRT
jgi:Ni/Fe-hydrogenase subunit HybB-like protein